MRGTGDLFGARLISNIIDSAIAFVVLGCNQLEAQLGLRFVRSVIGSEFLRTRRVRQKSNPALRKRESPKPVCVW
jgi:hypothetical protein